MTAYRALALQTRCNAINGLQPKDARARIAASLLRIGAQIASSKAFIGDDLRLVVLPEYALSSYPMGETFAQWIACACLQPDGPEYQTLGRIAADNAVTLCLNAYETDAHFPGLYFQASVVVDARGEVILRYRRLISMYAPTPHDVWDRYLEVYGLDAVFPVADTALGRLACIASEEILYPEIARAHALRGAEIFLHSTSEIGSPALTTKDIAKRARAVENLACVISANSAGIVEHPFPNHSTDGMSKIVDWNGQVLAEAGYGESMVAHAEIDLDALRRWRNRPGMGNLLSRQRLELFRDSYAGSVHPANSMLDAEGALQIPERGTFRHSQLDTLQRMRASGLLRAEDAQQ